jgi:hypothetical protein
MASKIGICPEQGLTIHRHSNFLQQRRCHFAAGRNHCEDIIRGTNRTVRADVGRKVFHQLVGWVEQTCRCVEDTHRSWFERGVNRSIAPQRHNYRASSGVAVRHLNLEPKYQVCRWQAPGIESPGPGETVCGLSNTRRCCWSRYRQVSKSAALGKGHRDAYQDTQARDYEFHRLNQQLALKLHLSGVEIL